jgi:hypothetical protein
LCYWIHETEGRKAILGREDEADQQLDYQDYRLGFRDITSSTNERTMICSIIPPEVFVGNTIYLTKKFKDKKVLLFVTAILNSFPCDFVIRQKITSHCSIFYVYQLPIPRLTESDKGFAPIVERAAKLICTSPEFDDLAKEVGLGSYKNGVTDVTERQRLRAELDALVAHLYGLTEEEFTYILTTFPLVSDVVKVATQNAFRDAERGLIN